MDRHLLDVYKSFIKEEEQYLHKRSNYTVAAEEIEKRRKDIKDKNGKCLKYNLIASLVRMEAAALSEFLKGKRKKIMPLHDYCWLVVFFAYDYNDALNLLDLGGFVNSQKLRKGKLNKNVAKFLAAMKYISMNEKPIHIRTVSQALKRFECRYESLKEIYEEGYLQFMDKNF